MSSIIHLENIRKSSQKMAERGKMSFGQASALVARISTTDRLEGLGGCELVIEAILEDLGIKKGGLLGPPEFVMKSLEMPEVMFPSENIGFYSIRFKKSINSF